MSGAYVGLPDEERKSLYLARKMAKESAYNKWRSAERVARLQQCIEALNQMHSGTVRQVATAMGCNLNTVKKWMQDMHARKVIYIFEYVHTEGCPKPVPSYRVGNCPDSTPERKAKQDEVEEDEMDGAWKKHEAWKRTWVPHCDVAAQWMMERAA